MVCIGESKSNLMNMLYTNRWNSFLLEYYFSSLMISLQCSLYFQYRQSLQYCNTNRCWNGNHLLYFFFVFLMNKKWKSVKKYEEKELKEIIKIKSWFPFSIISQNFRCFDKMIFLLHSVFWMKYAGTQWYSMNNDTIAIIIMISNKMGDRNNFNIHNDRFHFRKLKLWRPSLLFDFFIRFHKIWWLLW